MRKRKVTPEPSLQARRQAERGTTVGDRCRTRGVPETTCERWTQQSTGLDVSALCELTPLRDEPRRLQGVVADVTRDTAMVRDARGHQG